MLVHVSAFPDWIDQITLIIAQDEMVAYEYLETATFTGSFQSPNGAIPPTNQSYSIRVATFFRVNFKGLIAEMRSYFDRTVFISQTGISLHSMQMQTYVEGG